MKFPYYSLQLIKETNNPHNRFIAYPTGDYAKIVIESITVEDNSAHPFLHYSKETFYFTSFGKIKKIHTLSGHPEFLKENFTDYEYDDLHNRIKENGESCLYIYNGDGNLMSKWFEKSNLKLTISYDDKQRMIKTTTLECNQIESYTEYKYDGLDRVIEILEYGYPEDEVQEYREKGIVLKYRETMSYIEAENNQTVCTYENLDVLEDFTSREQFIIDANAYVLKHQYVRQNGKVSTEKVYTYTYTRNSDIEEILETQISYHDYAEGQVANKNKHIYTYQ